VSTVSLRCSIPYAPGWLATLSPKLIKKIKKMLICVPYKNLGYESFVTTQVYTHVDFEQKKKAIETFNIF
jgi:hypothetical protein